VAGLSTRRGGQVRRVLTPRGRTWLGVLSAALFLVILDVFLDGPLVHLDVWVHQFDGEKSFPALVKVAWAYDKVGQRSVTIPILLIVAAVLARRNGTWRPVSLAVFTVLILNVVVGAMKVLIGRSQTETGVPDVLTGGVIFPSGHSSNMVLSGGLIIYLLSRYAERPPLRLLTGVVAVATLLTCATSIYIGSHWVSDLIGGALVGGILLQAVIVFDRATIRIRQVTRLLIWRRRRAIAMGSPLLGFRQGDGDRVDAVPVSRRSLGGIVEDMSEMGAAPAAADLRTSHAE
jgi:membrane-associated phospholipid phosphatase